MLEPMLDHHIGRIVLQPIQTVWTILVSVITIPKVATWVLSIQSCILVRGESLTVLVGPWFHKRTDGQTSSTCRCPKLIRNISEACLTRAPPSGVRVLPDDLNVGGEESVRHKQRVLLRSSSLHPKPETSARHLRITLNGIAPSSENNPALL
jgi:hypothetical protein